MAVVLLQLKLAIQRRSFGHGGTGQRLAYVGGWLLALVLGLGTGAVVAFLDSSRDGLGDLALVGLLTVVFLGWVLVPVVMPGLGDQTVDPARLEQYPISPQGSRCPDCCWALSSPRRRCSRSCWRPVGPSRPVKQSLRGCSWLPAAVVFTVLCVAASRSVQALLSGVLQSRRGRDLVLVGNGGAWPWACTCSVRVPTT